MENFPSNSRAIKPSEDPPAEKITKRVVTGKVTRRKKSLNTRLRETFLGDDTGNVFLYVFESVLIPALKDMITDAGTETIQRMIYGEDRTRRDRTRSARPSTFGGGPNSTPYNRYSGSNRRTEPRTPNRPSRPFRELDDIFLDDRGEAEDVLVQLEEIIETYEQTSLKDLYEILGQNFSHVHEKWGWTNLKDAQIRRARDGLYQLKFPPLESIE